MEVGREGKGRKGEEVGRGGGQGGSDIRTDGHQHQPGETREKYGKEGEVREVGGGRKEGRGGNGKGGAYNK